MDWYPWYSALYEADTLHLTPAQDGIYRRLIDWYMSKRRPLPGNDQALAAIARIGLQEWLEVAKVIRAFFKPKGGVLHQKRCDIELDRQDKSLRKHSEISKKGAAARWSKNSYLDANGMPAALPPASRADAIGQERTGQERTGKEGAGETQSNTLPFPDSPSPPHTPSPGRVNGSGGLKEADSLFEAFWRAYPSRLPHPNPKKTARAKFEAAIKGGVDPAIIVAGAKRYARYIAAERTDPKYTAQAVTWLNQERWTEPYELRGSRPSKPMPFEG